MEEEEEEEATEVEAVVAPIEATISAAEEAEEATEAGEEAITTTMAMVQEEDRDRANGHKPKATKKPRKRSDA